MKPYIVIIYASFAVFLVVAVLLVRSFLAPASGSALIMSQGTVGSTSGMNDFFYKDMLISGVTGGLMAGKLAERRVAGGLIHAIVLCLVGFIIFFLTMPPVGM